MGYSLYFVAICTFLLLKCRPLATTTVEPVQSSQANTDSVSDLSTGVTSASVTSSFTYAVTVSSDYENVTSSPPDYIKYCPSNVECHKLGGECIDCAMNHNCFYGKTLNTTCSPKAGIICLGPTSFLRSYECRYCYQTDSTLYSCTTSTNCQVTSAPRERYQANCTVSSDVICLGRRSFYKMIPCNWSSGKRWSTALALSVTLGGFGADRFYLGQWREGIGKLFSFGGLGIWTLVDVILVATGYVGPADGSLYIF